MNVLNFTKKAIESLRLPPDGKRAYYKDSKVRSLEIMVTDNGTKSFKVNRRINGRPTRVTLGHYPEISIENARAQAYAVNSKIAQGTNPNADKKKLRQEITLKEAFDLYMERHSKIHKKSWKYDEREINSHLSHWFQRKLSAITQNDIQMLHQRIGKENGIYAANRLLERIRCLYNKAIQWGYKGENSAFGIQKFKEKSRDRFIQPDEFPKFFKALDEESNETARDYIKISLFTGARKGNVLAMRWDQINFEKKTWRIPETKNGEPLDVVLPELACEILNARKKSSESEWVFPSSVKENNHFQDPKKAWKRVLQSAGITDLRIHDLRRTLGSWQASLGASSYIIGKSLGHKSQQSTAIYARLSLDPVRASVELAAEAMFNCSPKESVEKQVN